MVSALQSIYRNICAEVVHKLRTVYWETWAFKVFSFKRELNVNSERPSISKFEVFITKLQRRGAKGPRVRGHQFRVRSSLHTFTKCSDIQTN